MKTPAMMKAMRMINIKTAYTFIVLMLFVLNTSAQDYEIDKPIRLLPDTSVADVAIADMNGDNKPDIIVTNPVLNTLMVLMNKSIAGKIDSTSFNSFIIHTTGVQPSVAAITDVDKDGKPDVFVLSMKDTGKRSRCKILTLYKNESKKDSIKLLPVLFADSSNKPNTDFLLKPGDTIVKLSDINSDGKPELLILNAAGFISIYTYSYIKGRQLTCTLNKPVIIPVPGNPFAFDIIDFDDDKKPDIIAISSDSSCITVLHNRMKETISSSSFEPIHFYPKFQPLAISFKDVDADNKPDAVIIKDDHSIVFMKNISLPGKINAMFTELPQLHVFSNYNNDLMMHDLNGDNRPELLSQNAGLKDVYLYMNKSASLQTGNDYFSQKRKLLIKTIPDCITDIDGDGTNDIIIGSYFGLDIYHGKPVAGQTILMQPIAMLNYKMRLLK